MSKETLFLYQPPFVGSFEKLNADHPFFGGGEIISDNDRQDEKDVQALVRAFAVRNDLIVVREGKSYQNPIKDVGSWIYRVNWSDPRSLILVEQLTALLDALRMNEGHPLTLILELHTALGILMDHSVLNRLCHRTLSAVSAIPYATETEETWEDIHRQFPYLWLVIYLQTIVRQSSDIMAELT